MAPAMSDLCKTAELAENTLAVLSWQCKKRG